MRPGSSPTLRRFSPDPCSERREVMSRSVFDRPRLARGDRLVIGRSSPGGHRGGHPCHRAVPGRAQRRPAHRSMVTMFGALSVVALAAVVSGGSPRLTHPPGALGSGRRTGDLDQAERDPARRGRGRGRRRYRAAAGATDRTPRRLLAVDGASNCGRRRSLGPRPPCDIRIAVARPVGVTDAAAHLHEAEHRQRRTAIPDVSPRPRHAGARPRVLPGPRWRSV